MRTTKTRVPADYLKVPNRRSLPIDKDSLALEFLMNSLRLTRGFEWTTFEKNTGLSRIDLDRFVAKGRGKGLLKLTPTGLQPTTQGLQFLNDLLLLVD